jgi:hypothetical protein
MNGKKRQDWVAPADIRLPDFIICGAMKCGTSTVHALLNKHPHVYIPDSEINLFDIDDIFQHADFFLRRESHWVWPDISNNPMDYWEWYSRFFSDAPQNCLVGEDSTCYLPSARASYRISLQSKPIKTIICLRQPTSRAYSQYWHMLRTGRAIFNFEDTIKFTPHYVLERSMYLTQILEFMKNIPRERIFFFILEEFLEDKEATLRNLASFLSLSCEDFPENTLETHTNRAKIPRSIKLRALHNRMLRVSGSMSYMKKLPYSVDMGNRDHLTARIFNKLQKIVNPSIAQAIPKIEDSTKDFLNQFFRRELEGLGDIVGADLDRLWFGKGKQSAL